MTNDLEFVAVSMRELALRLLKGEKTVEIPFFPDISDWYKVRRLPRKETHKIPTGSFIPDDRGQRTDDGRGKTDAGRA